MKRRTCEPRKDWKASVEQAGMIWHTPYWNEAVYYELTETDVATIKAASETLYRMLIEAGKFVISRELFREFDIPEFIVPAVVKAWQEEPPALNYGRLDLGFNGAEIKLLEFNCDTPTSLLEGSVVQWQWKEKQFPKLKQANEIHEYLLEKWRDIVNYLPSRDIHIMAVRYADGEDVITATYMAELAREAGLRPKFIAPRDIGWDARQRAFVDTDSKPITTMYKLYPWEWMLREDFGKNIAIANTVWIEPVWKTIWSNKAILPILWQLYPQHPLLLEASFSPLTGPQIIKPALGREGRGVRFSDETKPIADPTLGRNIYQRRFDIGPHDGKYPIIGSWLVDGNFAGIGIREGGLITGNTAPFVPHVIGSQSDAH
jgi:glutathionylspermidine synthase